MTYPEQICLHRRSLSASWAQKRPGVVTVPYRPARIPIPCPIHGHAKPCPACKQAALVKLKALYSVNGQSGQRGYDAEWKALAKAAIELQPWCSWCGATADLTGDHIDPEKRTGLTLDDVQVLCRPCNAKKSRRRAARKVGP